MSDASSGSEARAWPSPVRAWWMMAVFFLAAILSYTDRLIFSLLVDPLRADIHVSDTQVSLLQGLAFALIYCFAGLPLGRAADLFPRRLVIIAGVCVWSAATLACGLAQSFGWLFVARICVGVGEAALAPAAVSMIADYFPPERRGMAIGVLLMGMGIGSGAALAIGGALLEAANSGLFAGLPVIGQMSPWRAALILLSTGGIAIVALLMTVREPERRGTEPGEGALPLRRVAGEFARHGKLLVPLYLAVALVSAGDYSLQNWTPALLSRNFHLSPGEIGGVLGVIAMITGIVGTFAGGSISDWLARRRGEGARLGAAMAAVAIGSVGALIAFAPAPLQVFGCFAVWLLLSSASEAIGITMVLNTVPNQVRGIGVSLVSFCNMLIGLTLGTSMTAIFTDKVYRDPTMVGWSMTTVVLPAAALALVLFWRARRVVGKG